jgi:hypothetical protein
MSGAIHRVELPPEEFIKEAINIVEEAQKRGVVLRILGAVTIYIHSLHVPQALEIYNRVGRFGDQGPLFTDLDLIAYSKQRPKIVELFEKVLGFKGDMMVNALFGHKRLVYYHPKNLYHVDIFFDKLEFSHDIFFGDKPGKGRLELDYPTITLADLMLEKLQIHQINFKDLVDVIVLLYGHDLCGDTVHKECVDAKYIAKILADDWGFWYDATQNLGKVKNLLEKLVAEGKIGQDVKAVVEDRINRLLKIVDEEPKTKNWLKRAKIGTSKPWYREVEELIR